jgi:hypothetical protein
VFRAEHRENQMDSAPHLRGEDRPEFERVLRQALYAERIRSALQRVSDELSSEQLREAAMESWRPISGAAAPEYARYVDVRARLRDAAKANEGGGGGGDTADGPNTPAGAGGSERTGSRPAASSPVGLTGRGEGTRPPLSVMLAGGSGSPVGVGSAMAVLTPILAGAAAVIFLFVGYIMGLFEPEPVLARSLRTAGWLFAAISIAGVVFGMIALVLTALRHSSGTRHESPVGQAELAAAKEMWRTALLERGFYPFLTKQIRSASDLRGRSKAGGAGGATPAGDSDEHRWRRPGYSSPGFSTDPESILRQQRQARTSGAARNGPAPAPEPGPDTPSVPPTPPAPPAPSTPPSPELADGDEDSADDTEERPAPSGRSAHASTRQDTPRRRMTGLLGRGRRRDR